MRRTDIQSAMCNGGLLQDGIILLHGGVQHCYIRCQTCK